MFSTTLDGSHCSPENGFIAKRRLDLIIGTQVANQPKSGCSHAAVFGMQRHFDQVQHANGHHALDNDTLNGQDAQPVWTACSPREWEKSYPNSTTTSLPVCTKWVRLHVAQKLQSVVVCQTDNNGLYFHHSSLGLAKLIKSAQYHQQPSCIHQQRLFLV